MHVQLNFICLYHKGKLIFDSIISSPDFEKIQNLFQNLNTNLLVNEHYDDQSGILGIKIID